MSSSIDKKVKKSKKTKQKKETKEEEKKGQNIEIVVNKNRPITNDDTWLLIDSYFQNDRRLVQHQYDSFDHYLLNDISTIVEGSGPITVKTSYDDNTQIFNFQYQFAFKNVSITKPTIRENDGKIVHMYPSDARLRSLTYWSDIYADIDHSIIKGGTNVEKLPMLEKILIGKTPIMLKSQSCILSQVSNKSASELDECEFDQGGYFIIKGSEKVIVCQERLVNNTMFMFKKADPTVECKTIVDNKMYHTVEVKYLQGHELVKIKIAGTFKKEMPIFILFRALGVVSDKEIIDYVLQGYDPTDEEDEELAELLKGSLEEANFIKTQQEAFDFLHGYMSSYLHNNAVSVLNVLETNFLFHLGTNLKKKALYLGMMVKKVLLLHLEREQYDDRDSFFNKRIHTTGMLMSQLFAKNFEKMVKDLQIGIEKDIKVNHFTNVDLTIQKNLKWTTIADGMKYGLSTGNWGLKSQNFAIVQKGIAQVLERKSFANTLSHLRKVNSTVARKGNKQKDSHILHNTSHGYVCPVESPEGENVGLLKQLSLMTIITLDSNDAIIKENIVKYSHKMIEDLIPSDLKDSTIVFINGNFYCITNEPHLMVKGMKELRRKCIINPHTSICWEIERQTISIYTDGGRMVRPLFVVENGKILLTYEHILRFKEGTYHWDNLIKDGIIEYIDVKELDTCMLATNIEMLEKKNEKYYYNYTHCEIQESMLMGPLASVIPFINCNQGPRNIYSTAHIKQAIGIYATNFRKRFDTMAHVLHYPQKPLVTTRASKYTHIYDLPAGINAVVAVMCYGGYNQEDSLIFSQGAIDRGLFRSDYYKTYKANQTKNQSTLEDEKFGIPVKFNQNGTLRTTDIKSGSYEHLDERGFAKIGSAVKGGDVLIGKITPLKSKLQKSAKYKDTSVTLGKNDSGIVDNVFVDEDFDGYEYCKVRVRIERSPIIGDKFASRVAQKGTMGISYRQEDMPFTKEGISPDLIINPHAFPSRMTIGQLDECITGKVAALEGAETDATAFEKIDSKKIGDLLEKHGYHRSGNEILYNGKTGEQMTVAIFIGPTYYQRLKHMVLDKIHSRTQGPVQHLTKQPSDGRSRDGGLRQGEMERDVLLAHGSAQFLKERTFDCSDKYFVFVCTQCGLIASANVEKNKFKCLYCKGWKEFKKVNIPYASKLFIQEMMSLAIALRIKV